MVEFLLATDPADIIVFSNERLGEEAITVNLKLTNTSPKDVVFKVKCTSNEMFRIRPPMGILQSTKSDSIRLVFNPGKSIPENRKHYFAVYYIHKPEDPAAASKTARELWTEHFGNPDGTHRLYVEFKKEKPALDGSPCGEAKETKDGEKKTDGEKKEAAEGEKKEAVEGDKKEVIVGEKKEAVEGDKQEGEKENIAEIEKEKADAECQKENGDDKEKADNKKDSDDKKDGADEKDAANKKDADAK